MATAGRKLGGFGRTAALLAVAAAAGCDGGGSMPMSGRQLLAGRDIADLFFWQPRTLGFTRDTAFPQQAEPQDFWVWPLDEAAPTMALPAVHWSPPQSWPLWVAGELMLTGERLQWVYDIGTRQRMSLEADVHLPGPVIGERSLRSLLAATAMRSDGHGFAQVLASTPNAIVVGRPTARQTFVLPEGASAGSIVFIGTDLAVLIKQKTDTGDVVGVQRLNTSTGELTTLVEPTAADEWEGVTGFCDDDSLLPCGYFGTVGCRIDEPACPDGNPTPCLIVFNKFGPENAQKVGTYVHDVGAADTRQLDGTDTDSFFADSSNHLLAWGSLSNGVTRYWNMCTGATGECPGANELAAWRPDGGAFVLYGSRDLMRIVDVAGGTCATPEPTQTFNVQQVQYSPDSARLWWVASSDLQNSGRTLWLADAAAQAPVAVTSGPFLGASFTSDGRRIYVSHLDASTAALGWIDVGASPPAEHILSTNYGDVGLLGSRRALFVDHFNAQDGNGELVLVDLDTGATQSLAPAVTSVVVSGRSEDEGTDVAYAVRGRAAAARDGLWLTTLPP